MTTLVQHITDLAGAIRDKLNLMSPRLLPAGGASGQVLKKSGSSDYAVSWSDAGVGNIDGGTPGDGISAFSSIDAGVVGT